LEAARQLLRRQQGATRAQVLQLTKWHAIGMGALCEGHGELTSKDNGSGGLVYFLR
jgi:hypothetical protein